MVVGKIVLFPTTTYKDNLSSRQPIFSGGVRMVHPVWIHTWTIIFKYKI